MSKAKPRFLRTNPPLPAAIPNLFAVYVLGKIESQQTVTTFYYADGGAALVAASEQNIASGWYTAFGANFASGVCTDWSWVGVKVQCLTSPTRMPYQSTVSGNGGGPSGHEPTTVGATILRMSGIKGQSGRGRITMPALSTAWVTNSSINTTGQGALASMVANCAAGFVASAITYVAQIVSRGNKKSGPPLGASPVLTSRLQLTVGSCRRRKLGRGK